MNTVFYTSCSSRLSVWIYLYINKQLWFTIQCKKNFIKHGLIITLLAQVGLVKLVYLIFQMFWSTAFFPSLNGEFLTRIFIKHYNFREKEKAKRLFGMKELFISPSLSVVGQVLSVLTYILVCFIRIPFSCLSNLSIVYVQRLCIGHLSVWRKCRLMLIDMCRLRQKLLGNLCRMLTYPFEKYMDNSCKRNLQFSDHNFIVMTYERNAVLC